MTRGRRQQGGASEGGQPSEGLEYDSIAISGGPAEYSTAVRFPALSTSDRLRQERRRITPRPVPPLKGQSFYGLKHS